MSFAFQKTAYARVAQWIRAFACGAKGRVFESRRGRLEKVVEEIVSTTFLSIGKGSLGNMRRFQLRQGQHAESPVCARVTRIDRRLYQGCIRQGSILQHQTHSGHIHKSGSAHTHPLWNFGAIGSHVIKDFTAWPFDPADGFASWYFNEVGPTPGSAGQVVQSLS